MGPLPWSARCVFRIDEGGAQCESLEGLVEDECGSKGANRAGAGGDTQRYADQDTAENERQLRPSARNHLMSRAANAWRDK